MDELERNVALVRAHYAAFWAADEALLRAQVADDFVDHASPPDSPRGPGAVVELSRSMKAVFPDMVVTLDQTVAQGDRVAVQATWRGTHRGPFQGIAATGRTVSFGGMVFWRIVNGRIAERWAMVDLASIARQIQA